MKATRTMLKTPVWMTDLVNKVSAWPGISTREHRFGGIEFRLGQREIGHVHDFGIADIPFTVTVRDALVRSGLARRHRWLPNSGWTTIPAMDDTDRAIKLLRLSFLKAELRSANSVSATSAALELQTIELSKEVVDLVRV